MLQQYLVYCVVNSQIFELIINVQCVNVISCTFKFLLCLVIKQTHPCVQILNFVLVDKSTEEQRSNFSEVTLFPPPPPPLSYHSSSFDFICVSFSFRLLIRTPRTRGWDMQNHSRALNFTFARLRPGCSIC